MITMLCLAAMPAMPKCVLTADWRSPLACGISPDLFGLGVTVLAIGPLRVGFYRE